MDSPVCNTLFLIVSRKVSHKKKELIMNVKKSDKLNKHFNYMLAGGGGGTSYQKESQNSLVKLLTCYTHKAIG